MQDQKFDITGMTCSACSAHVEKSVRKLPGIASVNVNLLTNSMTVAYDNQVLDDGRIISAVHDAGYGASVHGALKTAAKNEAVSAAEQATNEMKHRLIWSFVFLVPLFYISMGHMLGWPLPT